MAQATHLHGPLAVCQPDGPSKMPTWAVSRVPTQCLKQTVNLQNQLASTPPLSTKQTTKKTRPLCGPLAACQLDGPNNVLLTNSTRWPTSCYCMMRGVRILLPLLLGLTALLYMHVKATNDCSRPATIGCVPTQWPKQHVTRKPN